MKVFGLAVFMVVLGFSIQAQSFDDKVHQTLKSYLTDFPNQTQFSVAVINGDQTHFYGQVKVTDSVDRIDNHNSVFQIGSVSKVFTSTLLAKLVVEKKVKLTDTLQKFFKFPLKSNAITLEKLSNHTSGLPRLPTNFNLATANLENPYQSYAEADLKYYLTTEMKASESGESSYQYSNLGAAILAKALENATAKTYSDLLSEELFQPLEMHQSTLLSKTFDKNLVQGLNPGGSPTPAWDMGVFEGAGEILSTVEDLSKFIKAHFANDEGVFSLTTLPTFLVNENLRIGLGWHILQDKEGHDLFWHNGGTGGYSASIYMVPETQNAVIILSNVSGFHPKTSSVDELGYKLLTIF